MSVIVSKNLLILPQSGGVVWGALRLCGLIGRSLSHIKSFKTLPDFQWSSAFSVCLKKWCLAFSSCSHHSLPLCLPAMMDSDSPGMKSSNKIPVTSFPGHFLPATEKDLIRYVSNWKQGIDSQSWSSFLAEMDASSFRRH